MSWSLRFDEPIVLPDGAKLATLREAVAHRNPIMSAANDRAPAQLDPVGPDFGAGAEAGRLSS